MSTTAASAKAWVESNSPSNEKIKQLIEKLEARLEGMDFLDPEFDGNEQALFYLQSLLDAPKKTDQSANPTAEPQIAAEQMGLDQSGAYQPSWDASGLAPLEAQITQLDPQEKLQKFAELKRKLSSQ